MAEVFVGLLEVRPKPGCEAVDAAVLGAMARCYAVARTAAAADVKMRRFLGQLGFAVVRTDFCLPDEGTDWENPDSPEGAECVKEAKDSGEVVLGRLDTWISEDDEDD